jgi:hypothetical protein
MGGGGHTRKNKELGLESAVYKAPQNRQMGSRRVLRYNERVA